MKKALFTVTLFFSFSVSALMAPRFYVADSTCPKNAPFKEAGGFGDCISCGTTKALMMEDAKECDLCPNRTVKKEDSFGGWIQTNYCHLKKCPPNKPFYEENWNWSGCKSCQDEPKHIKKEECKQCPNMHWIEFKTHEGNIKQGYCVPNKKNKIYHSMDFLTKEGYISGIDGGTAPFESDCDNPHVKNWGAVAVETSKEECAKCSNIYMKNGWCYFK